jgi:hypothetical protein
LGKSTALTCRVNTEQLQVSADSDVKQASLDPKFVSAIAETAVSISTT